jgi:sphingosine kinase
MAFESDAVQALITDSDEHCLQDETGLVKFRGKACNLMLTNKCLVVEDRSSPAVTRFDIADIIGAKCSAGKSPDTYTLTVYRYILSNGLFCGSPKLRTAAHLSLSFHRDVSVCQNWSNIITALAANQVPVPHPRNSGEFLAHTKRKVLVFINPHSGSGMSLGVWRKVAEPMFLEAGVDVRQIATTHANHARDVVSTMERQELLSFDSVAGVGGDGIMFEITNGIAMRADSAEVFRSVALIPIPGGTGNGLAKSILFECNVDYGVTNLLFVALKGRKWPLDLSVVSTASEERYASFLSVAWGLISDVDILSERMRWLGEARLYVAAVYFMCKRARYRGKLSMLLATEENNDFGVEHVPPLDQPLADPEGCRGSWAVLEGRFALVWILQVSHPSSSMYIGPGVRLNDGMFTIYVAQEVDTCSMLSLLLSLDDGSIVKHPKLTVYRARAYRLEPEVADKGLFALDGEVVKYEAMQGIVQSGVARVYKTG